MAGMILGEGTMLGDRLRQRPISGDKALLLYNGTKGLSRLVFFCFSISVSLPRSGFKIKRNNIVYMFI